MSCDVCYGTPGRYPVINRFGSELYSIECPECYGSGETYEETAEERYEREQQERIPLDRARYEAAMAETRGSPTSKAAAVNVDADPGRTANAD